MGGMILGRRLTFSHLQLHKPGESPGAFGMPWLLIALGTVASVLC